MDWRDYVSAVNDGGVEDYIHRDDRLGNTAIVKDTSIPMYTPRDSRTNYQFKVWPYFILLPPTHEYVRLFNSTSAVTESAIDRYVKAVNGPSVAPSAYDIVESSGLNLHSQNTHNFGMSQFTKIDGSIDNVYQDRFGVKLHVEITTDGVFVGSATLYGFTAGAVYTSHSHYNNGLTIDNPQDIAVIFKTIILTTYENNVPKVYTADIVKDINDDRNKQRHYVGSSNNIVKKVLLDEVLSEHGNVDIVENDDIKLIPHMDCLHHGFETTITNSFVGLQNGAYKDGRNDRNWNDFLPDEDSPMADMLSRMLYQIETPVNEFIELGIFRHFKIHGILGKSDRLALLDIIGQRHIFAECMVPVIVDRSDAISTAINSLYDLDQFILSRINDQSESTIKARQLYEALSSILVRSGFSSFQFSAVISNDPYVEDIIHPGKAIIASDPSWGDMEIERSAIIALRGIRVTLRNMLLTGVDATYDLETAEVTFKFSPMILSELSISRNRRPTEAYIYPSLFSSYFSKSIVDNTGHNNIQQATTAVISQVYQYNSKQKY